MLRQFKILSAVVTWTLAVTLACDAQPGQWGLAIFVATIACVPTFWLMIDLATDAISKTLREAMREERQHTEQLVLAVATEFAQTEVRRLQRNSG